MPQQSPEQLARDRIEEALLLSGWAIHEKKKINLNVKDSFDSSRA